VRVDDFEHAARYETARLHHTRDVNAIHPVEPIGLDVRLNRNSNAVHDHVLLSPFAFNRVTTAVDGRENAARGRFDRRASFRDGHTSGAREAWFWRRDADGSLARPSRLHSLPPARAMFVRAPGS